MDFLINIPDAPVSKTRNLMAAVQFDAVFEQSKVS